MKIPEKLMKLKYYIIFSSLISLSFLSVVLLAPRFLTIVSYFWPLFVSTALFLFTVVFFANVSPLSTSSEIDDDQSLLSCAEKAGEGLLDYVAAPQVCLETMDDFDDADDAEEENKNEENETDETPVEDTKSIEKSDHIKLDSVAQGSESEVKSD